jgi:hypothetical protein
MNGEELDEPYAAHAERDGYGCLTAADADFPPLSDEPGRRHRCVCRRLWEIRDVAGVVVWQPVAEEAGEETRPQPIWVEPEDLNALPSAVRRLVARWLAQRTQGMDGSWVAPAEASAAAGALRGAATDLVEPLAEDSTIGHMREVLADLASDEAITSTHGGPTSLLRLGNQTFVDMRYHSAALDEIFWLRAALAHEAAVRRTDLTRATYPAGRRRAAEEAIVRMVAAACGGCGPAYRAAGVDNKAALASAGASDCLTGFDWMRHVDQLTAQQHIRTGTEEATQQ